MRETDKNNDGKLTKKEFYQSVVAFIKWNKLCFSWFTFQTNVRLVWIISQFWINTICNFADISVLRYCFYLKSYCFHEIKIEIHCSMIKKNEKSRCELKMILWRLSFCKDDQSCWMRRKSFESKCPLQATSKLSNSLCFMQLNILLYFSVIISYRIKSSLLIVD